MTQPTHLIQGREAISKLLDAQCLPYDPEKVAGLEVWPFLSRIRVFLRQSIGYASVDIEGRHLPMAIGMCVSCGMTYKWWIHDKPCRRCKAYSQEIREVIGFRPQPALGTKSPRMWRFVDQHVEDWLAQFLPEIPPPDPQQQRPAGWRLKDLYRACRLNGGHAS